MQWTPKLKTEYENLFATCRVYEALIIKRLNGKIIRVTPKATADAIVKKIASHREQYRAIAAVVNKDMPWWFIGVIHYMECGLDFKKHLHNGDPLTARTKRVPAGRPKTGTPPFTFEESAIDALRSMKYNEQTDWSVAYMLFKLEGYNGYGYRLYHPNVKSPYLWSMTNHYTKGKYAADGVWNEQLVSEQLGIAALIKRGVELKLFD